MLYSFLGKMCQVPSQKSLRHPMDAKRSSQNKVVSSNARTSHQPPSRRQAIKWWGASQGTTKPSSTKTKGYNELLHPWYSWFFTLWVLIAFCGSTWLYSSLNADIVERRKEHLANMCEERAWMLQDQFLASMNHVRALTAIVTTFHLGRQPSALDQDTFAAYTARTAFERPLMSGVAYAQRVLHSERDLFEKEHGLIIKNMLTKERQTPQDEYAPTVLTQDTLSHLDSIDMMSGEEDRENIIRARSCGKGVLTSPFNLLQSHHLGVVVTFTVYKTDLPPDATPEERIEATAGYVGGAFDFESLVENLIRQLAGSHAIIVNVYDVTNKSKPAIMYGPEVSERNQAHISKLDFGDPYRKYEMRCRFYNRPPIPWSAIMAAIGTFVICVLVGYIIYAAGNRVAKVEEDYRCMENLKVRAEAAGTAKSQFLATVSHEIRTPMNGVLGMLQMLIDTDLDATQRDYARTAHESGKQLIKLINEVLDQAKIESGRMELETVPFDLRAVLDDILSLFSAEIKDRGIELAVFVSEKVPDVLVGDPVRLHQIVTNLVGNCVKFTGRGHIFVCVHLAEDNIMTANSDIEQLNDADSQKAPVLCDTLSGCETADGRHSWENFKSLVVHENIPAVGLTNKKCFELTDVVNLVFSVEDTGVGIPFPAQERVFTPFMQADSSTSRNYGGTGIGLSISKCLVELMEGEIRFVSRPGVGTTFTFTVPFKIGEKGMLESSKCSHGTQSEPKPCITKFRNIKALVVDGKPVRSQVTRYHLQRLGVQVQIANNLHSAISIAAGLPDGIKSVIGAVDMVFVEKDAWSSGSGLTFPKYVLEAKQKHGQPPSMPKVILLAMSNNDDESNKAKEAGFVDVVVKPLRASNLALCLQFASGFGNKKLGRVQEGTGLLHSLLAEKWILVVDDNRVNRRVAAGALKKYGAQVECAESGKAAIAMLQPPHKFDACFMDVQMPEMDGFEATRLIRKAERIAAEKLQNGEVGHEKRRWHIPILAMTADVIHATEDECLMCGMDGYVSKPFEEEQLYKAVVQLLASKSASTQ